jgi:hypothetical protein
MPAKPPIDPDQDDREIRRVDLNALVGRNVIKSLGSPSDMLKIQVNLVGSERYRVNVMVGKDLGSARVGNSFFLTVDEAGNILTSTPKIVRLY